MGEGMSIHYAFTGLPPIGIVSRAPRTLVRRGFAAAEKAFAPLFNLGPISHRSGPIPYNETKATLDRGQYKGGQKPTWAVALERLNLTAIRELWNHFIEFHLRHPTSKNSVMFECYSFGKVRQIPDESSALPWRNMNFHM
jgi:hypothetical protein